MDGPVDVDLFIHGAGRLSVVGTAVRLRGSPAGSQKGPAIPISGFGTGLRTVATSEQQ